MWGWQFCSPQLNSLEGQIENNISHNEDYITSKINEENYNNEIINNINDICENENKGYLSNKNSYLKFNLNISHQNKLKNYLSFFSPFKTKHYKTNKDIKSGKNKLLGRKKKYSNESGEHDKFADDNLSRKCKCIILKNVLNYINRTIKSFNICFHYLWLLLLLLLYFDYILIFNNQE